MLVQFIAVCLCVNELHSASFQSSLNVRGKPILRNARYVPGVLQQAVKPETPKWVRDLRARIELLVLRHGYEGAKPFIRKMVEDTETKRSVLLDVRVTRDGESVINYEYVHRYVLRTQPDAEEKNDTLTEVEPEWLTNLRSYVKNLVSLYGRKRLESHLKPVITSLQETHSILVTDIDGNVMVKYKKNKNQRIVPTPDQPNIMRKKKRKRRRRGKKRVTKIYDR